MTATNLPADIATFIGREQELTKACQLLRHVRLLTLTGPGGVGKTRLAVRIAARLSESFDGAWIADLGDLAQPQEVSPERLYTYLALCLGIRHHGPAGLDVLLTHLGSRRVLLLLDGCEHLVPATRACVIAMLHAAPSLRIVATSRQALGADGEHTFVVPPLPLPDAIKLFQARAAAATGSELVANPRLVADLCMRLDGLPLAIQLAAARTRGLSVQQLLSRLGEQRFRVLADVGATDHRHSTMERVVEWSHELCTEAERLLWARAAVFARAVDLRAMEAVCGGEGIDPAAIVDLVTGLIAKSVLTADQTTSPVRYHLLDSLRDYGMRKLAECGDTWRVRGRHCDYYRDLAAHAAASWFGPNELDAMAGVHRDLPDIVAAVNECIARGDLPNARAICRDLVRVRSPFFYGYLDLTRQQLRRTIDASRAEPLTSAADAADLAATIATAAWVATTQGLHDNAEALLKDAHALHREWKIPLSPPVLFAEGGSAALGHGSGRAIDLLADARASFTDPRTAGDRHMATMMWAMANAVAGSADRAVSASEELLHQAEHAQAPWAISWALWVAALAAMHSGDHGQAHDLVGQGLRLQRDMDDSWGATWSIELCAWIVAAQAQQADKPRDEAERAAWLLGASRARQQQLGVTLAGLRPLADLHTRAYGLITAILDEVTAAAAMDAGTRGYTQAVRVALREPTPRRASASTSIGLTDRERQVASLVAQGLTGPQIAAQLRCSTGTVNVHVRNVLQKLGLPNRAAIAAWAASNLDRPA